MLDYMLRRKLFIYGYKEIVHYVSQCMCIRKLKKLSSSLYQKKHFLYSKGMHKLEKELDILNLVKSIRELRLMASVLLGPSERMLLKF